MPVKRWVKRHFDYVVTVGAVNANTFVVQVPLQINTRAPFVLRGRAMRQSWNSVDGQTNNNKLAMRYTGPDQEYLSQTFIPFGPMSMAWGMGGSPTWTQSPMLYAPGSVILTDVWNFGTLNAPNVQVFYRGYELWPEGSVYAPTYPEKFRAIPYTQVSTAPTVARVDNGPNLNLTVQCGRVDSGSLLAPQVGQPADLAIRGLMQYWPESNVNLSPGAAVPVPQEVFLQLYDWQKLSYSNAPIHIDVLAGNWWGFLTGDTTQENNLFGSNGQGYSGWNGFRPGLFTPEIYLPQNQLLWYDVTRNDAATFNGKANITQKLLLGWTGMKVLPQ